MSGWSKARWQQLASGPRISQGIFLFCCLALLLGLAYFVHLRALFMDIDNGAEQSQRLYVEKLDKAAQAQALATSEAQLAAAYQHLDVSRWRLAAGGQLADLLEDIARHGQASGVLVEQLEPLPEVLHEQHSELPMQLQLRGTYLALATFVHGLTQLPRLIALKDFALSPVLAQDRTGLRLQVRVNAYRSREVSGVTGPPGLEPTWVRPSPSFSRSPFEPPSPLLHRQYLETLALDQFEMVGSLARQQVRFALLQVTGIVHRLQVGDRIGRDNGQIVSIEEQQVEVAERIYVVGQGWVERRRTLSLRLPASAG